MPTKQIIWLIAGAILGVLTDLDSYYTACHEARKQGLPQPQFNWIATARRTLQWAVTGLGISGLPTEGGV